MKDIIKGAVLIILCWQQSALSFIITSKAITNSPKPSKIVLLRVEASRTNDENSYDSVKDEDREVVHVFDNVFSSSACDLLHCLAQEHNDRTNGGGGSIFKRPSTQGDDHNHKAALSRLSPMEQAIHSCLLELGDSTDCVVEYWSRQEHNNMDTHADIDEAMLQDDEKLRCPMMGHVLYLKVDDDVQGPTCVFPQQNFGWESKNNNNNNTDMVIVPAVQGRVSRFPGSAMHAVPKPANRWLHSPSEQKKFDKEDDLFDDYDYDDDDDTEDESERSVLLFNTWPRDERPPRGVDPDYATGVLPDGIEIDDDDDNDQEDSITTAAATDNEFDWTSNWSEEYGKDGEKVLCNQREQWTNVVINNLNKVNDDGGKKSIHVSLMGNKKRRLYPKRFVKLSCSNENAVETALKDKVRPSSVTLYLLDGE